MNRGIVVMVGLLMAYSGAAHAQACPAAKMTYDAATPIDAGGGGFTQLNAVLVKPATGAVTPSTSKGLDKLRVGVAPDPGVLRSLEAEGSAAKAAIVFEFVKADGTTKCQQEVAFASLGLGGGTSASSSSVSSSPSSSGGGKPGVEGGRPNDLSDCAAAAGAMQSHLSEETRRRGYTLLAFMQSGEICYANRLYGIAGQEIFIAVYSDVTTQWQPLRFEPCALESAAPSVFVSVDSVNLSSGRQASVWKLRQYPARTCYNATVNISMTAEGGAGAISYTLGQYQTYRGTLQLGAIFTDQFVQTFDVRPGADGQGIVYSRGPTGRGVDYTASLVLYGVAHYLPSLFGGDYYSGRDILHDQSVLDRTGLVLGVGLTNPGRRFVAGGSFELMYGLNLTLLADVFRSPRLVGTQVGESFSGSAEELRTQDRWKVKPVLGLSIDLLYVKEFFSGRLTP
jgi:hypothetical protein